MDIASVSMALAAVDVQTKVGTAMLSKAMDLNESLGSGMVELIDSAAMERSVNPAIGSNFDVRV